LADLTNLLALYLVETNTSDISPLSGLESLEHLDLRGNRIRDLSPLLTLPNVFFLYIDENDFDTSDESDALKVISELDERGVIVRY
jgi:internalin A